MAKHQVNAEDEDLLLELGEDLSLAEKPSRTAREERIIAGFEDIERFMEVHGRLPQHGEDKDIFERLYAVRLEAILGSAECRAVLAGHDRLGLLQTDSTPVQKPDEAMEDEALLAELEGLDETTDDLTTLTHVKPRAEIRAAEEIAQRTPCDDFDAFKPLFQKVQEELGSGLRRTRPFRHDVHINQGQFFILGGQKVYVAEVGEEFITGYNRPDRRLRVIYDNGTENDILLRSLQRALHKDEAGRRITDLSDGPLFADTYEDGDQISGTIYVLRSLSDHPFVQEHRDVIHKIGVTSGDIQRRIANAKLDPTFLMSDVEVVATYQLSNIHQAKLENLIHRFFESAKLNIEIKDRFGNPVVPREWFLVPLFVIDEAVEKIRAGSIKDLRYEAEIGCILKIKNI